MRTFFGDNRKQFDLIQFDSFIFLYSLVPNITAHQDAPGTIAVIRKLLLYIIIHMAVIQQSHAMTHTVPYDAITYDA